MSSQEPQIDPNTASLDELTHLPGIGKKTAEKIIELRPIETAEDLLEIPGISLDKLENLRPQLLFPPQVEVKEGAAGPEDETDAANVEISAETQGETMAQHSDTGHRSDRTGDAADGGTVEPEIEDSGAPAEAERSTDKTDRPPIEPETIADKSIILADTTPEPEAAQPAPQPPAVTRSQAMWMSAAAALFAFILGLAVTFSVLMGVNGGLRYASPELVTAVELELDGLKGEAEVLGEDIGALRTRIDNIESLSGRVTGLEESTAALAGDIEALDTAVADFQDSVEVIDGRVGTLESQTQGFQDFLNGLAELLKGFTAPEEAGNE